jgi:hypothetical protein
MQLTYEALLAEVLALREQVTPAPTPLTEEAPPAPLTLKMRVKAEAYEYRIYDLELAFMMELPDTVASSKARERMERVTAYYHRDYPDRPLRPRRDPRRPLPESSPYWPYTAREKNPRKPYTKRAKVAP